MLVKRPLYAVYKMTAYAEVQPIRQFHRWQALSAEKDGRLLILLDEYARRKVTVCEYGNEQERQRDIRVLQEMDDGSIGKPNNGGNTPPPAVPALLGIPLLRQ